MATRRWSLYHLVSWLGILDHTLGIGAFSADVDNGLVSYKLSEDMAIIVTVVWHVLIISDTVVFLN